MYRRTICESNLNNVMVMSIGNRNKDFLPQTMGFLSLSDNE